MDALGTEFTAADLWKIFRKEFGMDVQQAPQYRIEEVDGVVSLSAKLQWNGQDQVLQGQGTGPIDAFVQALSEATGHSVRVMNYSEHAVGEGANAQAVAYVEVRVDDSHTVFGVGMDANIVSASIRAILSGLRRSVAAQVAAV